MIKNERVREIDVLKRAASYADLLEMYERKLARRIKPYWPFRISLGKKNYLWRLLPSEARELAEEMGAIAAWRFDDCPDFETLQRTVDWFFEAVRRGLIPDKILHEIFGGE